MVGRAGERPVQRSTRPTSTSTGTRPRPSSATRCCMPVLGDHYGRVLEAGELQPRARRAAPFTVRYHDHVVPGRAPRRSTTCWPAPPRRVPVRRAGLPGRRASAACRPSDRDRPGQRPASATATRRCSARQPGPPAAARSPSVAAAVDAEVARDQRRPRRARRPARAPELPAGLLADGRPGARLPPLLRHHTPWSACGWRTSTSSRHPRLRPRAGSPTGVVDGLRVDHPDGLRDPERLPAAPAPRPRPDAWIVVEKILEPGERLPEPGRWPAPPATTSSTGRPACFVDPAGEEPLTDALRRVHRRADRLRRRSSARRSTS